MEYTFLQGEYTMKKMEARVQAYQRGLLRFTLMFVALTILTYILTIIFDIEKSMRLWSSLAATVGTSAGIITHKLPCHTRTKTSKEPKMINAKNKP
jgi:hypothetical protein